MYPDTNFTKDIFQCVINSYTVVIVATLCALAHMQDIFVDSTNTGDIHENLHCYVGIWSN